MSKRSSNTQYSHFIHHEHSCKIFKTTLGSFQNLILILQLLLNSYVFFFNHNIQRNIRREQIDSSVIKQLYLYKMASQHIISVVVIYRTVAVYHSARFDAFLPSSRPNSVNAALKQVEQTASDQMELC